MGSDNLKWLDEAVAKINDATAKVRAIESKMVAGFQFNGGNVTGTKQHHDYRAKLDEIHSLALQLRKGR
jgi:hypothetical protein